MKTWLRGIGLGAIILIAGSGTANSSFCSGYGHCTVTCASGATYPYYTLEHRCCMKLEVCGLEGGTAIWWPDDTLSCTPVVC